MVRNPPPEPSPTPTPPRWLGWLAVAAVAAFPVVEAVRILIPRTPLVLYGDQALIELGARRAIHLDQLVGPYSRDGFHHPGPALFYLLAPFERVVKASGPGLYLGAIVISGVALIATVAFVWRRVGPLAALSAAVAIDLFCLCVRVGTLREPWNPYLIVTPMVLFVVLWAAGITGSPSAGLWALVIGSYLVQTHIATAGVVIAMVAIWLAQVAWAGWRGRARRVAGPRGWGTNRVAAVLTLSLVWVAPLVELWRDQPNNLGLLWDFFTSTHAAPSVPQALTAAADAWTIVPFGNRDYVLALHRSPLELAAGVALLVIGFAVAIILGRTHRQPMSLALVAAGGIGVVIGTLSLALGAGPVYPYFSIWLAFVPASIMLAIGIALVSPAATEPLSGPASGRPGAPRWRRPVIRRAVIISAVAAVSAAGLTVQSDLRMGPITTTTGSGPWPPGNAGTPQGRIRTLQVTGALAAAAEGALRPTDRWVNITIGTPALWPYAAGIVLALDRQGIQSTVAPTSWVLYFGQERALGRPVSATFDLYSQGDAGARSTATGTVIADLEGDVLAFRRTVP